jgi:acyl-CoA dehydrogenase
MQSSRRSPWSTDDHEQFRETVRAWVRSDLAAHEERFSEQGHVDREAWLRAGELGILCTDVPAEMGGGGADFGFEAVVYEELLYADFMCFGKGVHEIAAHYLVEYGPPELRERLLPRMARGELIGAIAMSEPGAGSDLRGIQTSARRDGDDYVLNGSKTFITNGLLGNLIVTVVRTDPEAGSRGFTLLAVETDGLAGFRRGPLLKKIGQKAQDTCELFFDDCRVPASASLGEGEGLHQLMAQLPYERTIVAITAIAAIEQAVASTVDYTKQRQAFGKSIFDLQNTRFRLAEAKTVATIGRVFADHCIERVIDGTLDTETASMAKWWLTDQQSRVLDECLQLHGGYGYMLEYPISRAFVDARVQSIYAGSNEIMKEIIARSL